MYFSESTLIALTASLSALPIISSTPLLQKREVNTNSASVVQHLDQNGHVNWIDTGDNGRMAYIPSDLVDQARANMTSSSLHARGTFGPWTNIGLIGNFAAQYQCANTGDFGVSATIEGFATQACSNFIGNTNLGAVANGGWTIWQNRPTVPDADNKQSKITYRMKIKGLAPPSLTDTICGQAYTLLTSSICQGKDNEAADTRGGTVEIGEASSGAVDLSVDPNLPNEDDSGF